MLKNRFTSLVLTGIACIIGFSALLSGHATAAHELVIATDNGFAPFEFRQHGRNVGFDLDLWREIAHETGFTYRFLPMNFSAIIPGLISGGIDVALAGIAITDSRSRLIDFSQSYYRSGLSIMVAADSAVTRVDDLNGLRIAAKPGTTAVEWVRKNLKPSELRLFSTIDNAYRELGAGGVDAAIHDTPNVLYYIDGNGADYPGRNDSDSNGGGGNRHGSRSGKLRTLAQIDTGDEYGIAFAKGSRLRDPVDAALKKIRADGRYAAIREKWFAASRPGSTRPYGNRNANENGPTITSALFLPI